MAKVGIIGAGMMGAGIAQTAAQSGHDVVLADISLELAEKAKAGIAKTLSRLVAKEKIAEADAAATLARIAPVADYSAMADANFVIEAATEREDIKQRIFEAVGKVLAADAVLASNTSSIPITRMAAASIDQIGRASCRERV